MRWIQQNIADYPPADRAYLGALAELSPTLEQGQALGLRNADLFDMFCHWLVAVKHYSFKPIRYWKIAPGENARLWNDWQEGSFVAIGWDKLGDLSSITRNDFLRRVDHLGQDDDEDNKQACEQVWRFARQIGEGDQVLANQGTKKVLALGRVTGPYYFVPGVEYGHRLPVEWYDLAKRDGINRANLARVFGELMYLLEYRAMSVRLAAGGEPFSIPENLRILGTMNTADRSIALVDHALRRRFAFIPLPPVGAQALFTFCSALYERLAPDFCRLRVSEFTI